MLEQKAKVVKDLTFRCEVLSGMEFPIKQYVGEACFEAICMQLNIINDSFSNPEYLGKMRTECIQQEMESELFYLPDEFVPDTLKKCQIRRANDLYGITREIYEEAKKHKISEDEQLKRDYELFLAHYPFSFDRYSRLLCLIFDQLSERKEEKYGKILLTQMSKSELQFLYCHSLHDASFQQHLTQAGLDKLLKTECKSIISKQQF